MIPRYSLNQATSIWTDKNRYEIWLQIEILICEKLCVDKKISKIESAYHLCHLNRTTSGDGKTGYEII